MIEHNFMFADGLTVKLTPTVPYSRRCATHTITGRNALQAKGTKIRICSSQQNVSKRSRTRATSALILNAKYGEMTMITLVIVSKLRLK